MKNIKKLAIVCVFLLASAPAIACHCYGTGDDGNVVWISYEVVGTDCQHGVVDQNSVEAWGHINGSWTKLDGADTGACFTLN